MRNDPIVGPELAANLEQLRYLVFQGMRGEPGPQGEPGPAGGASDFVLLTVDENSRVFNGSEAITGAEILALASAGKAVFLYDEDNLRLFSYCEENGGAVFSMQVEDRAYTQTVPAASNAAVFHDRALVRSVNGKTGAVTLGASDVGALPSGTAIPSRVSDLANDAGFQTAAQVQTAVSGKADKTPRIAMTASDTTPTLEANKFYVFPEMASLAPAFATPADSAVVNEYHFIFTSGAAPTALTIPAAIRQPDGFTVEANMVYEVSVLENCMAAQGWAVSA